MKKKKVSLAIIIFIISTLLVVFITGLLMILGKDNMNETLYNILYEIDKALVLTTIIGTITKIVSDDIISVKKNDEKMRKLGIHSIGEGRLDTKQKKIMFGGSGYQYPLELKFCFITGAVFLSDMRNEIINAIKNGTKIKILIADPLKSKDFLARMDYLNKQDGKFGNFNNQINFVKNLVLEINEIIKTKKLSGSIELKHYIDEYRYNIRLAKYFDEKNGIRINAWINYQPMNKSAIDQSLTVIGSFDTSDAKDTQSLTEKESKNLVVSLEHSFDKLWDLY